ncbi:MAG: N-acetylneuraminate synthase [bacterium]
MSTLIIAEAGVNHNGDLDLAKQLIDSAATAGADLVKFQTFNADHLVTRQAEKAEYQKVVTDAEETQHGMLKRLELSHDAHQDLIQHCRKRNIAFFSTAFDHDSIDYLASLGQKCWKIPSGEITNLPYLRHIGKFKQEVLLSTGMATLGEIEYALRVLETAGTDRDNITVLHCTTQYPTPMNDVNLRAMKTIQAAFGVRIGYSDHTLGIDVAIAAVALGACVIEKHFTLDRSLPGPDHQASLTPQELKNLVKAIRNIEQALGSDIKQPTTEEIANQYIARQSIFASKPIKVGDTFSSVNLTTKRPATGLSPMHWDDIIGTKATRAFDTNEAITFGCNI